MQVRGNKDGQKLGALRAGGEYTEYKQNSEQVVNVKKNGIIDAFSTADCCPLLFMDVFHTIYSFSMSCITTPECFVYTSLNAQKL